MRWLRLTERQCGLCDQRQWFGNTCVDVICENCARTHNLCRHCGGDIEMKERRRKWPQRVSGEVPGQQQAHNDTAATEGTPGT